MEVELVDTKAEEPAPALETPLENPMLQRLLQAAGQKKPLGVDFFTDAGVLSAANIPSVVFGPGNIAQAHTADEWVEIAQLEEGTRLLQRFLVALP
jgi:acetylornithine deacetylase